MATSEKRQVTQLISALIILKRNAEVYLSGHMIITQSLNNAFEILQEILSVKPLLTIGVAHHLLFIKDDTLDGRSPYVQEFAVLLNNLGVISITFRRGITKDELLRLQNIFRTNPNDLWKRGSLQSNLSAHRITHVDLKSLDLRQFNITVEKEIVYEKVKDKGKSDKDWRKLIDAILTYDADMKGPMTAVEHSSSIESARLPIKKNEERMKGAAIIRNYEMAIEHYPHTRDAQERRELDEVVSTIHNLINDLHPQLKNRLLSAAETAVASLPPSSVTAEKFRCFPSEMITEMLLRALRDKRQISPSLICLFQKLSTLNEKQNRSPENETSDVSTLSDESLITTNEMESLIESEKYEEYIPVDYGNMLRQKTGSQTTDVNVDSEKKLPMEKYYAALEDTHLNFRIHCLLLSLLDEDINEDDYREFSIELTDAAPEYLYLAQFQFLIEILDTFRRHENEKSSEVVRHQAHQCIEKVINIDGTSRSLAPFISQGLSMPSMKEYLLSCGAQIIPWLLDMYLRTGTSRSKMMISEILALFGDTAIGEALKKLSGLDTYRLRKMLVLLRMVGDNSCISQIKQYMYHPAIEVRLEAIETLLKFNDADAAISLEKAVYSKNLDEASRAIAITCRYQQLDIIKKLTSRIKTFIISEDDLTLNEKIISGVMRTRHHSVMSGIVKVADVKWSLSPRRLAMTKMVIFESLDRFPEPYRNQLIDMGLRLNNRRIKTLCIEYAQKEITRYVTG